MMFLMHVEILQVLHSSSPSTARTDTSRATSDRTSLSFGGPDYTKVDQTSSAVTFEATPTSRQSG